MRARSWLVCWQAFADGMRVDLFRKLPVCETALRRTALRLDTELRFDTHTYSLCGLRGCERLIEVRVNVLLSEQRSLSPTAPSFSTCAHSAHSRYAMIASLVVARLRLRDFGVRTCDRNRVHAQRSFVL